MLDFVPPWSPQGEAGQHDAGESRHAITPRRAAFECCLQTAAIRKPMGCAPTLSNGPVRPQPSRARGVRVSRSNRSRSPSSRLGSRSMARASQDCSHPACPLTQPCPIHAKRPWQGSTRREKTVSGSRQQARRRYVIARDNGRCHVCGGSGADEADHVIPLSAGGADTIDNMAAIHGEPCHREKTAAEAKAARAANQHPR